MNIVIVEDNSLSAVKLMNQLQEQEQDIRILKVLDSVQSSVQYFKETEERLDLIFMDIQLKDGLSFNIFESVEISAPTVFVTGYDSFMLEAFKRNGIGYLVKPFEESALKELLQSYHRLKGHMSASVQNELQEYCNPQVKGKDYFICRRGKDIYLIRSENIVLFYSDDHVVFIIDSGSKKHIVESARNLNTLIINLDPSVFFRVNRRFIVNINFIQKFSSIDRVKLALEMTIPLKEEIIIGQESAKRFREWLRDH